MKRGEIARHVTRGAFFLAVEKGAALLSGMLYFALLLRWLGPTNYGMLTLALAIAGLAGISTGNFEVFLERYAAEYQARGRSDLLHRAHAIALGVKVGLGVLASVLLFLLSPLLATQFNMPELAVLLPILTVIVATDGFATTGRSLLFGLQRYEWVSGLSLLFHLAKVLLVGSLWWAKQGLVSLAFGLSGLAVMQAVLMSASAWALARRAAPPVPPGTPSAPADADPSAAGALPNNGSGAHESSLLRQMFAYCLPLLGARAAFLSGQNLGKVLLAKVLDATQLGYFTFAFQTIERFVELAYTLPSALLPSLTHLVAREERERLGYIFDQAFRLVQVGACTLAWVVFAFAPELTLWVGSPMFLPSTNMLRVLALVPIARTAQQPLTMLFQATRQPGSVLTLALIKLLVELSCYFMIVPRLGGMGASWANLAGAVAAYATALSFSARLLPETASERLGVVLRALLVTVPMLLLAWSLSTATAPGVLSVIARVSLAMPGIVGLFALRLVTRYDLEKLSALQIRSPFARRARDIVVRAADPMARVFEARRPA
ncbi:MAG TPA: lipopolysaccharide biosynthesis protein [Methylomirabilota bacterium]|nr:lipopolysaccharide biosynthesis protein [Methylomirabilota bacterium]